MKLTNTILLPIFFFISHAAFAQDYLPISNEGATWIQHCTYQQDQYIFAHKIEGDTIVDNTMWKKIYFLDIGINATPPYSVEGKYLAGIIRDDISKKVVYIQHFAYGPIETDISIFLCPIDNLCEEEIYMDFNLIIGDTIQKQCALIQDSIDNFVVTAIEEEQHFGQARKVIKIDEALGFNFIEGIGYPSGLFIDYSPTSTAAEWSHGLLDYCIVSLNDCNLFVSSKQVMHNNLLSVKPNPSLGLFEIDIDVPLKEINIYDTNGKSYYNGLDHIIDLSDAPPQIYFVKVLDEFGKVHVQKVVKQ